MPLSGSLTKHTLQFTFNVRTSRGSLREKDSYIIKIWEPSDPELFGIGECSPLKGLSIDYNEDFENILSKVLDELASISKPKSMDGAFKLAKELAPKNYPSIRFGLEIALIDLFNGGNRKIFKNKFSGGGLKIPINGLVWMGDMEFMLTQITELIYNGFDCIKMKIGSLDFDRECDILAYVRNKYFREEILIRVDANGAFKPEVAMQRLDALADYNLHSIEQPIKPGKRDLMRDLCGMTPVPIGLDEDLIGIESNEEKKELVEYIRPQFLILKPTLIGGFQSCQEWISIAEEKDIGWWITSALESNVGLNAIAQFSAQFPINMHQGLGTGGLFQNNLNSPMKVNDGFLEFDPEVNWDLSVLEGKDNKAEESEDQI